MRQETKMPISQQNSWLYPYLNTIVQEDQKCDLLIVSLATNYPNMFWIINDNPDMNIIIYNNLKSLYKKFRLFNPIDISNGIDNPVSNYLRNIVNNTNQVYGSFQPDWYGTVSAARNPLIIQVYRGETVQ